MTIRFAILCGIIAVSDVLVQTPPFPFQSVVLKGDTIIATFSNTGSRWLLEGYTPQPRLTEHGESLKLRQGISFTLIEKHSSYRISSRVTPLPAGVQVESQFDAQSFGGATTKKSYFIKAE